MGYPPVVVVDSGGVPRTQVAVGASAPAYTVVESGARPITLADNAPPIALFNEDGTPYAGVYVPTDYLALRYKDADDNYRNLIYNSGAAVYRVLAYHQEP